MFKLFKKWFGKKSEPIMWLEPVVETKQRAESNQEKARKQLSELRKEAGRNNVSIASAMHSHNGESTKPTKADESSRDDSDFAMSFLLAQSTDSAMIGMLTGGDMNGAILGATMLESNNDSHSNYETPSNDWSPSDSSSNDWSPSDSSSSDWGSSSDSSSSDWGSSSDSTSSSDF
jgi:hypothetical protein